MVLKRKAGRVRSSQGTDMHRLVDTRPADFPTRNFLYPGPVLLEIEAERVADIGHAALQTVT